MIKKINDRLNSMSKTKQIFVVVLLFLILIMLAFIVMNDRIKIVEYSNRAGEVICTETYINGKLNGSACNKSMHFNLGNEIIKGAEIG